LREILRILGRVLRALMTTCEHLVEACRINTSYMGSGWVRLRRIERASHS
jgi:hypothetical protein